MDDRDFKNLLDHFGFSWDGYRKVRRGVKKRLRRHMQLLGCRSLADYLEAIQRQSVVRAEALRRLAVPISRIMRDGILWETLANAILPDLAARFGLPLQVWSAGCAGGEEVCSLVIAADRFRTACGLSRAVLAIWATDLNPACLLRARQARYPRSSLREVPTVAAARYFSARRGGRAWQFNPCAAATVSWQCQSIEAAPRGLNFHLVCLRNSVLTYYAESCRVPVLEKVVRQLVAGGVLVVGSREGLPPGFNGLAPWSAALPYVFVRQSGRESDQAVAPAFW